MLDRWDEDRRILVRQIGGITLISVASLFCRALMTQFAGRSTIVVGLITTLPFLLIFSVAIILAIFKDCHRLATIGFGALIFFMTLTYLFDAVEAALHFGRIYPLADETLANIDRFLAFDWLAYAHWMDHHEIVWEAGRTAYLSMPALALFVIAILSWAGMTERLATYLLVQIVCLGIVACVGAMMPAVGTYEFYRAASTSFSHNDFVTADHMSISLAWLRQDTLVGNGVSYHGLVSFPSYHAMSCVIYIWALWPCLWLRWPTIALNSLILIATPVQGSHYLIDLVAGVLIAGLAIKPCQIVVAMLSRAPLGRPASFQTVPDASNSA